MRRTNCSHALYPRETAYIFLFYARTIQFIPSKNPEKALVMTLEKKNCSVTRTVILIDCVHDN